MWAWPAQRLKPSASPRSRAAARIGAVAWWTCGKAIGAACGVLDQEAVDDPAREAAAEGAGQRGRLLLGERLAVGGVGAGLGGAQEGGPELRGARPGGEDGGDRRPVAEPARGDERQVDLGGDEAKEDEDPESLGAVAIHEGGPVAARLDPLEDQHVGAGARRRRGPRRGR